MKSNNIVKIGIDVGGTFTDIILADMSNNKFYEEKVLTDHANPRIAILEGLTKILNDKFNLGSNNFDFEVIHGTTLFTNALISRTETSPALFVTKGAEDIIYTGKGNRYDPYDNVLIKPNVLVPKNLRFKIDERILVDGTIFREIDLDPVDNYLDIIRN